MAASKPEEEEELMVVTVDEDGDLRFHPEVLESLLNKIKQQPSKNEEIPVVIIGVIGEPNTNKACYVNLIRYYIDSISSNNQSSSNDLDWILQVWNDVKKEKRVEYGNVKYGLSIGSSKPRLVNTKDGSQVAVLVLDIWYSGKELSNGIKTSVYNKLIDLCLYLSSVVVYTGFATSSTSPKNIKDYLWMPSESEVFKNFNSESFQNLFIILQEWSFKHLIWFGKDGQGPKSFLESTTQPFSPLLKIKNLSTELKSKFQKTACYLLPSGKQDEMIFLRNINQLVQNILYNNPDYTLTPVFRQGHTVTIKTLEILFWNGVSISNNPTILTENLSESSSGRDQLRPRPTENDKQETRDGLQNKRFENEPNNKTGDKKQEGAEKQQQNSKQKSNNNQQQQQSSNQEHTQKKTNNIDQHQPQSKKSTSDISIAMGESSSALTKSSAKEQEELNLKSILENYEKEIKEKFHGGVSVDKLYFEEGELKQFHVASLEKIENEARDNLNTFLMKLNSRANERYNKICAENSGRQKKYEKLKNDSNNWFQNMLKGVQVWMKLIITDKSHDEIFLKIEDLINREAKKITQTLEHPWNIHFTNLFNVQKHEIMNAVNSLLFGIKSYEEKMRSIVKKNIYLTPGDFEIAHADSFLETIVENPGSGEVLFKDSMNKAILHIKSKLVKQNSVTAGLEEKISNDAINLVTEEYHKFMKSHVMPNRILTDKQIEQLHTKAANLLSNSFLDNPDFNFTPAWKTRHSKLKEIFNDGSLLNQYLQENEQHIENLKIKRKKVMEEAERTYKETMNYFLQSAKLTESRMYFFHETSMKKGLELYINQMGRDGAINWDRWGNVLTNKMNNLSQSTLEENEITIPVSESSYRQDEIMMEQAQNQNFGVGIYIGPNVIMSSILKEGDKLSEFSTRPQTLQLSPFIAFMNEKICFGEEAKEMTKSNSNYNFINVYEILTHNDTKNLYNTVEIYGETFKLRPEEILALFLHHLKLELENKCVLDSPINSCVVAYSAFIYGTGKEILKSALMLAGFHNSTLIHTITAMGISYQLAEKPKLWWSGEEYKILVIHEAPGIFDVARINVCESSGVKVKSIFGLPDIPKDEKDSHWFNWSRNYYKRDPTPEEIHEKNIKNLIRETLQNFYTYKLDEIVMIDVNEAHRKAVEDIISRKSRQINKNRGILVGATALSLSLNTKSKSVLGLKKSLEYEERTPFQLSLEHSDGKVLEIMLEKNVSMIPRNLKYNLPLRSSSCCVRLTERSAKGSGDTEIVSCIKEFKFVENGGNNPFNIIWEMSMAGDGVLDVTPYLDSSTPDREINVFYCHAFMDEDELGNSMKTLTEIFPRNKKMERKNEKQPMAKEKLQLPSSSNNTTVQPRVSSPSTQKKNLKATENKSTENSNSKLVEIQDNMDNLKEKLIRKLETVKNDEESLAAIKDLLQKLEKK